VPGLGRNFLPPFNEGSLTVAIVSPLGTPLADGDALHREVEKALLAFPEVVSTSRRTGRAEKDEHVQGVNASEMEVVLREGRPKAELLAEMRRSVALVPGAAVTFGQPISHRIDHMISGSKTNLAVKIFGPDLAVLRGLAADAERRLRDVPGIVDLSNQEQQSVPQLLFDFDREAMARLDLSPAALARGVEALFQGTEAGEIVEGGLASRVVVRFPERLRKDRERLVDLPVTVHEGRVVRLGEVARVRFDLGPGLVRRENVQRLAMLTANVEGADLVGAVERARVALEGLPLPPATRSPSAASSRRRPAASRAWACSPSSPSPACTACSSSPSATAGTSRSSSSTSPSPSSGASPRWRYTAASSASPRSSGSSPSSASPPATASSW
jgi:Cu/Ag efflux pump CusA